MRTIIAFIMVCAILFIGITNLIIYLNNNYTNVFRLEFDPLYKPGELSDSTAFLDSLRIDSLRVDSLRVDSLQLAKVPDSTANKLDSLVTLVDSLTRMNEPDAKDLKETDPNAITMSDSAYAVWRKKTVKMYEAMDPQQCAQVILKQSDNIARDILYSMKQKKAAAVLSFMTPADVARLTKAE